jgi:hypothetical protein
MATQNRKSSSGRGRTTKSSSASGKKTSGKKSNGKNNRKESQGPDLLTIIVVLIAVVLVVVLLSKYKKEQEGGEGVQPTGTVTATVAPDTPTPEATPDGRPDTPHPTQSATQAPTSTPEPTPTEEPVLSQAEAEAIAKGIVRLEKYSIELLDDHLMIDGAEYYSFCINDENGAGLEPLLIVERKTGKLLCYDMTGVVATIDKFPLDKVETGNEGAKTLTAEEAKQLIAGYSGERLGLAKETSVYEMTVDDWTTNADGVDCYGVNFFETVGGKQRFRGTFYVALDGSAVYAKDDITGEFSKR